MTKNTIDFEDELDKKGAFIRKDSSFRNTVCETDPVFKPEAGRYHLYVSLACPWAHRTLIVRALKGLDHIIDISIVDWLLGPNSWEFTGRDGATLDTVNNAKYLRELYFKADKDYNGRFTVPVLWDKKTQTIVNNESSEIIRMFNTSFNQFAKHPELHFYPEDLKKEIDEINEFVYPNINNGVYRCGFATSQEAYEEAYHNLFNALDKVEDKLSKSRYLVGNRFTEADIRLFTTLVRFDCVYVGHFKCNRQQIKEYPNLSNYLREIYQMEGIKPTVNFFHIKHHYYGSHGTINPTRVVPVGPNISYLDIPHTRSSL